MNGETKKVLTKKISSSSSNEDQRPQEGKTEQAADSVSKESEEDPFKRIFEMFSDQLELK